jgi:flagellar M-ring protein FliF
MEQFRNLLANLSLKQRISLIVAALLVSGGLFAVTQWNRERDFKPLYTGLAAEDAGALLARLRESGVEFRLNENGSSILVPSSKVAELRLQMAAAGLPKTGKLGFELFDKTNFGATDFAEQVNYHRAIEGELERSLISLSEVEQARVHVTFPKDSLFVESRQPAKASVLVKLKPGARLSPQNVLAICHLLASAVEGLNAESVSVLDMQGNLLNRPRKASADGIEPSEAGIEYRQKIEKDMLAKIQGTLEPLLGQDKFRAGVFVDCDFSSGELSEETLNPDKSVMLTSMRTDEGTGVSSAGGIPGTPSNLPRPATRASGSTGGVSRHTENITYQTSRTVRHTRLPQGIVKKISASLLIDHNLRWEGSGATSRRITEAPSPEKLKAIKDLVAGAIGFSAERGDQLIVESLPFESTLSAEPVRPQTIPAPAPTAPVNPLTALPPWLQQILGQKNMSVLIGIGAGIALLLLLGVVFLFKRKGKKDSAQFAKSIRGAPVDLAALSVAADADLEKLLNSKLAEQTAAKEKQASEALSFLKIQPVTTKKTEVLTKHISEEAKKDPTSMAYIVRTWLNEPER